MRGPASRRVSLLRVLGIVGWLVVCGHPPGTERRALAILRVPLPRDILTLDPADAGEITTHNVVRQLYEGLVDYDPRTLGVVPRIARAWSVSPNGLEWRFELHPNVCFIDDPCFPSGRGREVTALDAKYSIERGLNPYRGTRAAAVLPPIAGLPEFLARSEDAVSGIRVESPLVLRVYLVRPDPTFLHFLVLPPCRILPREAVEAYGGDMREHAVGTGPFRLVSWQPLSGVLLVRNRHYWRRDDAGGPLPYLDALRFVPAIQEVEGGTRLYRQGKLDIATSSVRAPGPASSTPEADPGRGPEPGEQRFFVPRLNTIYLRFDYRSTHPIVRDRRLRRVLSFAALRLSGVMWQAARGLLPPGIPGSDPDLEGQRTDLREADRLLREAGYPAGRGLPTLRLAWLEWDAGAGNRVAASLRRVGLQVDLEVYSVSDYERALEAGLADVFRSGWIADYPDPETFLELFYSGSPDNLGGYASPEFDGLFEAIRVELDGARRVALARRLERLLLDDVAAIFLHHERQSQFVSARVANWEGNGTSPLGVAFYEQIKIRPGEFREP